MSIDIKSQNPLLTIRSLGVLDYEPVWVAMKQLTDARTELTSDEIWLLQHPPVFTQGQAGKPEHVLFAGDIPVIQVDRGGQVTYHGPGQLVAYLMIDIKRRGLGARALVSLIEQAIIDTLGLFGVKANARQDAPGVYVEGAKIASLGLRIRKGCSFHGLSINVDMDMEPFSRINPCGYKGMDVVQLSQLEMTKHKDTEQCLIDNVAKVLVDKLVAAFGYETVSLVNELPQ